ncbi:MAG: PilT/PilU family type 4a pilus ATPase [Syntrophaceae bacterium]|nr:PilT/PilU family type 4a pilus ATPase [Syntrophaceae bacterium]
MKRFESLVNTAIKESMSDVHIAGEHPVVTRKFGEIQFHNSLQWTHQEVDNLTLTLLNPQQLEKLKQKNSVDIAFSTNKARLRINVFNTMRGISIAIRILPGHIPTIEELNLHPLLHDISKIKSGLVLICGANGVGKTTTIAAIINEINKSRQSHIVTIEDPVEYRFQSQKSFIEQRELGTHTPSFKQGLIDVLREDADVIFVGELREGDVMQLALNAAETGHLVIATMHAGTPEEVIYRMCNAVHLEAQNELRNQLASVLKWIVIQQLVYMEKAEQRVPVLTIVHGTPAIKNTIRENKIHQLNNVMETSKDEKMFSPEHYLTDYLKNRSNFTPYKKIFRPTEELSPDDLYQSPILTGEVQNVSTDVMYTSRHDKRIAKQDRRKSSRPIASTSEYSDEKEDNILDVNDDVSLHKIVEKLKKK